MKYPIIPGLNIGYLCRMKDQGIQEKLYKDVLEKRGVKLSGIQDEKFRYACMKAVAENPEFRYFDQMAACHIYLNFILNNPEVDLGPVKRPNIK
ncbi:MAG: hypothetical protein WC743_04120 [Mucilaginibacter sp.]